MDRGASISRPLSVHDGMLLPALPLNMEGCGSRLELGQF